MIIDFTENFTDDHGVHTIERHVSSAEIREIRKDGLEVPNFADLAHISWTIHMKDGAKLPLRDEETYLLILDAWRALTQ